MKIVIAGDGKVGFSVAEQLSQEGHDLTMIDNRSETLRDSINQLDILCVQGDVCNVDVQMEAGVDSCDLLIACTSQDETNLLACMVARKLGAAQTIARTRNPQHTSMIAYLQEELGVTFTVNPELSAAQEISRVLRFPAAMQIDTLFGGNIEIAEYKLAEGNPMIGEKLMALPHLQKGNVLVGAVQRGDTVTIPRGDFEFREGDIATVIARPEEMAKFCASIKILRNSARNVMIVGGSRIAYYLAQELSRMGMHVKIVDIDRARCLELTEMLPGVQIVHGDGTDQKVLLEEGLLETDGFIGLMGNDEQNLILSMFASYYGVEKVIAKVDHMNYPEILRRTGIETIVSPKDLTTNSIVRHVRAMQNTQGNNVEAMRQLVRDQAEALQFIVRSSFDYPDVPLMDLPLKPSVLIGAIQRKGRCFIPKGRDTIREGDNVIILSGRDYQFKDINDIFQESGRK